MTLEHLESLCMKVADGLATAHERAELEAAGVAVEDWAALPGLLREALDPGEVPDLSDDVMAALGLEEDAALSGALKAAFAPDDGEPVGLSDDVLAAIGLADPWPATAAALAEGLRREAGPAPDLAALVMAEVAPAEDALLHGFADGQLDVSARAAVAARLASDPAARAELAEIAGLSAAIGEAVRASRGPAPALWDGVAAAIGLDPDAVPGWDPALLREAVRAEAGPAPSLVASVLAAIQPAPSRPVVAEKQPFWRRLFEGWSLPALAMGAAAALALAFPMAPPPASEDALSYSLSPVNHVEIEDISSEGEAMVQVLQFEDDAPTIIFIDEGPTDGEGATL